MRRILVALFALAICLGTTASPAVAHERRNVGPYQVVVGFINEPSFAGAMNAVDLRIMDTRSNNKPVEGLEKTLQVEVFYGGLTKPLPLSFRTRFGQPGAYAADFMPTKHGAYIFRIFGKIESTDVNERFESGPGRFNDVEKVSPFQYPESVPSGGDLTASLNDLRSSLDQLRLLAIVAIIAAIVVPLGTTYLRRSSR